jgi:hypothetical protein
MEIADKRPGPRRDGLARSWRAPKRVDGHIPRPGPRVSAHQSSRPVVWISGGSGDGEANQSQYRLIERPSEAAGDFAPLWSASARMQTVAAPAASRLSTSRLSTSRPSRRPQQLDTTTSRRGLRRPPVRLAAAEGGHTQVGTVGLTITIFRHSLGGKLAHRRAIHSRNTTRATLIGANEHGICRPARARFFVPDRPACWRQRPNLFAPHLVRLSKQDSTEQIPCCRRGLAAGGVPPDSAANPAHKR